MAVNMNANLRSTDGWVLVSSGAGTVQVYATGSGLAEVYQGANPPAAGGLDPGIPVPRAGTSFTLAAGDKLYARCAQLGPSSTVDVIAFTFTGTSVLVAAAILPNTFAAYQDTATGTVVWAPTNKTAGSVATVAGDPRFGVDSYGRIVTLAPIRDLSSVALTYSETPTGGAAVNTTINGTISPRAVVAPVLSNTVANTTTAVAPGTVLNTVSGLTTGSTLRLLDASGNPYGGTDFILSRSGNTATIIAGLTAPKAGSDTLLTIQEVPPGLPVIGPNVGMRLNFRVSTPPISPVPWANQTQPSSGGSSGPTPPVGVPVNSAAPAISGTAQVGQTLTATAGTWSNSPTGYAYQWNRGGSAISGATASTYVPVSADAGTTLTVSVIASNASGAGTAATSAATSAVVAASTLPLFKAAVAKVKSGTNRAIWAMVGDSVTAGWGAGASATGTTPGTGTNLSRQKSLPTDMAALFTSNGVKSRADAVWGSDNPTTQTAAAYAAYDTNVAFTGAGWGLSSISGAPGIGGNYFTVGTSTRTGTMALTPQFNANTVDIYYVKSLNNGGFTVSDSSGTLATVDCNDSGGSTSTFKFAKITVSRTAAASKDPFVLGIATTGVTNTGGAFFVGGIVPYDTTTPMLEIWNMGWAGSKVSDWIVTTNGFNALPAIKTIVADLWSIELGANDANGSVAASTYQTNLSTLLGGCGQGGSADKLLIACHPGNPTSSTYNIPQGYKDAMTSLASTNGLMTPPDFSSAGLATADYYDQIHLFASGYSKEASYLYPLIAAQI